MQIDPNTLGLYTAIGGLFSALMTLVWAYIKQLRQRADAAEERADMYASFIVEATGESIEDTKKKLAQMMRDQGRRRS